jgi:lysyl-tRNA synthetase class 2
MHNPEFTMLEFYTAYFDCRDVMATTEKLVAAIAARVLGGRPARFRGRELSFATPFPRLSMKQAIVKAVMEAPGGLDGFAADVLDQPPRLEALVASAGFAELCRRQGVHQEASRSLSHGKRIAQLFDDLVQPGLWEPTFITDHPVEVSPLAKARVDDPTVADRFELFVAGMEIANGFSELNDPLEQRARFLEQLRRREGGDEEAHAMDDDYVRALGHGLPPTGGCGLGIDRLAMVLTGARSIRDVILFPQLRPEPK